MRIIVVEDEYRTRCGVVKLVNKINPEYLVVGEAENGIEGLELIKELKPDLVIVDISMPLMDGIEMLSKLKKEGIKHKTIILSGYSEFDYAQKAIKIGVNEYLLKPVTANDLEQTINNIQKELQMERLLSKSHPKVINTAETILQSIVLGGSIETEEMFKYLWDKYGINSNNKFALITVYTGVKDILEKDRIIKIISSSIKRYSNVGLTIFELTLHNEIEIILYDCDDFSALERLFQNTVIKELLSHKINGLAFGWIIFNGLNNLKNSLNILRKELKWSAVLGEDVLISYPKTQQINTRIIQYPVDIETNAKAAISTSNIDK